MSFVHCHGCNWEQDDFWNKSYNPVRYFLKNDLPVYIRPRMMNTDPKTAYGRTHSWMMLLRCIWKWTRRVYTQVWWTYEAWREDVKTGRGGCPNCGNGLCID